MSRKIEDLTLETQSKYYLFSNRMHDAGIDFIVTCTKRTAEEQLELYKQGREFQNGVWVVIDKKKLVTWTLNSNHIKGTAFDIAIMLNGKILWSPTLDADGDGIAEYTEAGRIGESVGLTWGGSWATKPDAPHFELKG